MKNKNIALIIGVFLILSGCATNKLKGVSAPQPELNGEYGVLYLFHAKSGDFLNKKRIYINDVLVAKLGDNQFTWLMVKPGKYKAEMRETVWTMDLMGKYPRSLFVDIEIGKGYKKYLFYTLATIGSARTSEMTFINGSPVMYPGTAPVRQRVFVEAKGDSIDKLLETLWYVSPQYSGIFGEN